MKIDLIIFDLDGTLVNSIPDLTNAINHVATHNNMAVYSEIEVSEIVGSGITKLIERAFNVNKDDLSFSQYLDSFINFYSQNHSHHSHLYNNVKETLEHFKSKKLAILSNKLQPFTKQIVVDLNINNYFDLVIGATKDLAKKPSAEPINYILQKLKIEPAAAIMIGDSEPDILAARSAGIHSVAVTYGYRSRLQLEKHNPDFIIDDINELTEIVE